MDASHIMPHPCMNQVLKNTHPRSTAATYVHSAFLCESIDNIDYVNEIENHLAM